MSKQIHANGLRARAVEKMHQHAVERFREQVQSSSGVGVPRDWHAEKCILCIAQDGLVARPKVQIMLKLRNYVKYLFSFFISPFILVWYSRSKK